MTQVEGPGYAYEIDYGPGPETATLSQAREALATAEREARWAHHEAAELDNRVAELRYELRYAVCDHPDTTGWRCDDCGEFVPLDEEYLAAWSADEERYQDHLSLPADADSERYASWRRARYFRNYGKV